MRMAIAFLLLTVLASWPAAAQPAAQALEATGIDVSAERASPEACVTFDRPLASGSDLELRPFVAVTPAGDRSFSARGDRLCVGGLRHGERYDLTVRPGLVAADGSRLAAAAQFQVAVPDRAPAVSFRGRGDVLPLGGDPVLPVTSVNTDRVQLELFKIVDRSLIDRLAQGAVGMAQSGWSIAQLEDRGARRLFSGTVAVEAAMNREVATAIPLRGLLGPDEPGVYVAVARLPNAAAEDWQDLPTCWFTLTDTGLLTWQGEDGLLVRAASLTDGKVLPDRELMLMSRSNRVIASVRTGADGYARFEPGELRGTGSDAPQALFAYGPAGEFTWLDFDRAGIDLTDRGVDGRTPPAALDAFLWTERGVYRPGETVQLGLLLRDRMADAVTGLPLVLVVTRPIAGAPSPTSCRRVWRWRSPTCRPASRPGRPCRCRSRPTICSAPPVRTCRPRRSCRCAPPMRHFRRGGAGGSAWRRSRSGRPGWRSARREPMPRDERCSRRPSRSWTPAGRWRR